MRALVSIRSSCAFQVKCTAISVPKADSVVWNFAGRELNFSSNNTVFHIQEEYTGERVVSTVTLLDPISSYFGDYNCTVTNSYGTDSIIIKLTANSESMFLYLFETGNGIRENMYPRARPCKFSYLYGMYYKPMPGYAYQVA